MKSWFSVKNRANNRVELSIHDEIGLWGVSASDFINELDRGASEVHLSIHSPGGSALDGIAMYNALKDHPAKVTATVEGIAASAASIVAMGADELVMPEDAFLMIHNPWTVAQGESEDLRSVADTLDKMRDSLVNIYHNKTGIDHAEIESMLSDETWMNGREAHEKGFVDTLREPVKIAALSQDFAKHFKTLPKALSSKFTKIENIDSIKEFEAYLREEGGFSHTEAKALVSKSKSFNQRDVDDNEDNLKNQIANLLEKLS